MAGGNGIGERKEDMRTLLKVTVVFALVGAATSAAAGYKVTKVIEVGPAVSLLNGGALKWSPDGTMLAYFANNHLMISDTLGNSRQVAPIGVFSPMRAAWVSNSEFAVNLADRRRTDSVLYRLVVFDIDDGSQREVRQCWETRWSLLPGHSGFDGPYVTLEGNAYYEDIEITGLEEGELRDRLRSTVVNRKRVPLVPGRGGTQSLANSHLQVWGKNGLYAVDWGGRDSTILWQESGAGAFHMWTAVSNDKHYVFNGGKLINSQSGEILDVGEYAGTRPANTEYCDFGSPSFNPRGDEILFWHFCEGGDTLVIDRVATFDISTREFTLLDTLTGISGGSSPVYNPNGRMIAFFAHGKGFIVWREETELVKGRKI
jgi:hypothetical protein